MPGATDVSQRLRREIVDGLYNPGERLLELQLTARFGVGRAAVRTALTQLEQEGLLVKAAHRGAAVRKLEAHEIDELYEARAVVEGLLGRHAAQRAQQPDVDGLRRSLGELRAAAERGDAPACRELAEQLRGRLWELSGHRVASEIAENLRNRTAQVQRQMAASPAHASQSLAHQEVIVEAVAKGATEAAERAVQRHLLWLLEEIQRWNGVHAPTQ